MNGNLADYQKMFDCLDVMLFIITPKGDILAVNTAVIKRLGYSREELIGQNALMLHPPGPEKIVEEILSETKNTEEVLCSVPIITKQGERIETATRIYKGTWEKKKVLFGFCSDVTLLKATEKKCEAIFRNSPVPILVSRISDGLITDVNDAWCLLMGCEREKIIGKTTPELGIWVDLDERTAVIDALKLNGFIKEYPLQLLTLCGDIVYGMISGVSITINGEDLWITSFVDHTEQYLLEQQMDNIRQLTISSALEQLNKQMETNKFIKAG